MTREHKAMRRNGQAKPSPPHQAVLKTRAWQQVRLQVLARDPYCTLRYKGCRGASTHADHNPPLIKLWKAYGSQDTPPYRQAALDPHHLRGTCDFCNCSDGARHRTNRPKTRKPLIPKIRSKDW